MMFGMAKLFFRHPQRREFALLASTCSFASPASAQAFTPQVPEIWELVVVMLAITGVYLLPTIIAFYREHPNRWLIAVINIVFGGTGLGWLLSLIWSFNAIHKSSLASDGGESGLNLFINDPKKIEVTHVTPADETAGNVLDQLQKLKALHEQGIIIDDEFDRLKKLLLDECFSNRGGYTCG